MGMGDLEHEVSDEIYDQVNPFAHHLTHSESVGFAMCMDKIERYVAKGRINEAKGMRSAVMIMWQALLEEPLIDTGWGEL